MQGKHRTIAFILGFLLLTNIFSIIASPLSASGHERDTGYQLVVTQQKAETGYGADMLFTAVLSFPVADAPIDPEQFQFIFNNKSIGSIGYSGQSNGQATFILQYSTTVPLPIGQYTVSATYFVTGLQTTIQSNTVIHTIGKGDIGTMACLFSGPAAAPGQTIKLYVQLGGNAIDPHIGTYGVAFIGPATVNYPTLVLDSANYLTMQAPSVKGNYTLQCRFNGTNLYNATQQPDQPFVVSAGRQPAAMRLYTSPTTIVPGHLATLYVVVPTTPGLPAPTGTIFFFYDGFSTNLITLGQGGGISVSLTLPGNDPNHPLYITYSGDDTYARESDAFSLTNPPITGQPSPPPTAVAIGGKGNAPATATPVISATATEMAATSTPLPPTPTLAAASAAPLATTPPLAPSSKTGSGTLLLVVVLFILGFGGSAAGVWYVKVRGKPTLAPVIASQFPLFPEMTEPFQPPLDGDITQL